MPRLLTFLSPEAGKWYIITKFNKEVDAILYDPKNPDPAKNPSSLRVLGWPYGRGNMKLQFTEFVSDIETAKNAIIDNPRSPDFGKKKYISYQTFFNSNLIIGTRQEYVDHLNKIEAHPAVVEVTTDDGASLEIIIAISFEITDPISTKRIEDFLVYGTNFIIEAFRLWCNSKTFRENRMIKTEDSAIPDEICDQINKLNKKEFSENGFFVPHVAVTVVAVAERSIEFLESEQRIAEEANKALANISTQEIELLKNKTQGVRNDTKVKLLREEADIQIDVIEKTSVGIAKQNAAWGGKTGLRTLIMNGDGKSDPLQTIQIADANAA